MHKLAQLALQKIDSQQKMASSTEISKQLDSIQDWNPTLKSFLISMAKCLESQQDEITELRSDVQLLKNKLNDVERYQPKDCVIFRYLPLLSNRNVAEDVVHSGSTNGLLCPCCLPPIGENRWCNTTSGNHS